MSWVKINDYNLSDRFQELMVQEIYKFHQIDSDYNDYNLSIWIQNERDELNYSIKNSFDEIKEWLGFYPRPIWKEVKVPIDYYNTYYQQELVVGESAWLNDLGVRAVELIEASVTIPSKPTASDYVTLTITTDEITDGEIRIFHVADDSFNNVADDRFRILPTNIYYNGTAYEIRIPYARLIKPELWLDEYNNGDPQDRKSYAKNDTGNYVTSVDIYRVYNDSTIQAKVVGPPFDFTGQTSLLEQNVNVVIIDEEEAKFKIIETGSIANFIPTHVVLNAYIGYPLTEQNYMHPIFEEFICRKTKVDMGLNAKLAEAKISEMWQYDYLPSYTKVDANSAFGGVGYMPNPIGARNIDVEMFKKFLPLSNWRGKISDTRFWLR